MAFRFEESAGSWNSSNTKLDGSVSKNGYGFYIGVVETRVGNADNNTSDIAIQIAIHNGANRFNSGNWKFKYTIDNKSEWTYDITDGINIATNYTDYHADCKPITFRKSGNTSLTTLYVRDIPHDDNGSKTINIKVKLYKTVGYGTYDPGECNVDANFTLTTIPRYFSSTPSMSVTNITETSAKINWSTPETCANVNYRIGANGTWATVTTDANAKSGSYTVTGLRHNTNYTIYGDFKRRDSGLWSQVKPSVTFNTLSGAVSVTKLDVNVIDESNVDVTWGASHTCDALWYSTDNGATWVGVNGYPTFRISGLSAGKTYNFKVRVKRQDTQELGVSGTVQKTMYNYPYMTSMPDFTIGDAFTLKLYNPLGRSVIVNGLASTDGSLLFNASTAGTSMSGFNDENSKTYQYKSIPNSRSGMYRVQLICKELNRDTTVDGGTYSIIGTEKPILPDADYWDVNPDTIALTGDNKILVDNYSTCRVSIPVDSKGYSNYYANIIQYNASWGAKEDYISFSSDNDVSKDIDKSSGNTVTVKAVDSRGLSSDYVTKIVQNVSYINSIVDNVSTERKNGIEQQTSIGLKVTLWNGNWGVDDRPNDIQKVAYMCKMKNSSEWSQVFDITNLFKEKAIKKITDEGIVYELDTDDELYIHANGTNNGFEIGKSYDIQVIIADGYGGKYIYESIGNATVTDGKVGMSRYKDSDGNYHYGFNGMPDDRYTEKVYGDFGVTGEIRGGSLFDNDMRVCKTHNFGTNITDANELQNLGSGLYVGYLDTNVPVSSWYFVEQITASASTSEPYCLQRIWSLSDQRYNYTRKKIDGTWRQWIASQNDYRDSEQCIGTWINGKPIYRKVVTGNLNHDAVLQSNVDTFINARGTGYLSTLDRCIPYYEVYGGQVFQLTVVKNASNQLILMSMSQGAATTAVNCYIVIEYTKTTD